MTKPFFIYQSNPKYYSLLITTTFCLYICVFFVTIHTCLKLRVILIYCLTPTDSVRFPPSPSKTYHPSSQQQLRQSQTFRTRTVFESCYRPSSSPTALPFSNTQHPQTSHLHLSPPHPMPPPPETLHCPWANNVVRGFSYCLIDTSSTPHLRDTFPYVVDYRIPLTGGRPQIIIKKPLTPAQRFELGKWIYWHKHERYGLSRETFEDMEALDWGIILAD